ncbi:hypothetical protein K438DRAFT_1784959 [Mycena galopus ATCC 62051]|nr:hypothetical protein K438DRAFT_1784959 [Mycena galopus ATCC 62051]
MPKHRHSVRRFHSHQSRRLTSRTQETESHFGPSKVRLNDSHSTILVYTQSDITPFWQHSQLRSSLSLALLSSGAGAGAGHPLAPWALARAKTRLELNGTREKQEVLRAHAEARRLAIPIGCGGYGNIAHACALEAAAARSQYVDPVAAPTSLPFSVRVRLPAATAYCRIVMLTALLLPSSSARRPLPAPTQESSNDVMPAFLALYEVMNGTMDERDRLGAPTLLGYVKRLPSMSVVTSMLPDTPTQARRHSDAPRDRSEWYLSLLRHGKGKGMGMESTLGFSAWRMQRIPSWLRSITSKQLIPRSEYVLSAYNLQLLHYLSTALNRGTARKMTESLEGERPASRVPRLRRRHRTLGPSLPTHR